VIPAERAHLLVSASSHPGMSGKNNEDRFGVSAYRLDSSNAEPVLLAVVADGIGGHRAGEVAAQLAVETISSVVAASSGDQPVQTLRDAIQRANAVIYAASESDPSQKGMGSTCACAWVIGDRLYTASVGDSRIYLVRAGFIRQLTVDHTWVQEAIDSGALDPETAHNHPNAHVIRRYLGSPQPVVPDFRLSLRTHEKDSRAEANQGMRLLPGDRLLLTSDGLTDLVDDQEILKEIKSRPIEEALGALTRLANERGGHDNITIVTLAMPVPERATAAPRPMSTRLKLALLLGGLALLAAVAVLAAGGLYLFVSRTPGDTTAVTTQPVTLPGLVPTRQPAATLAGTPAATRQPTTAPAMQRTAPAFFVPPLTLTPWPTNTRAPNP
jgi:serine/threonine protein phosphatase PrpC